MMRRNTAELLESCGGELREGYSGRCMYGKETDAVVFDNNREFMKALVNAAYELGTGYIHEDRDLVMKDLEGLRTDSMGLGMVAY